MSTLNTQQEFFAIDWMGGSKMPTATVQGLGGSQNVGLRPLFAFSFFVPLLSPQIDPYTNKSKRHPPQKCQLRIIWEAEITRQQESTNPKKGSSTNQQNDNNGTDRTPTKKEKYQQPYFNKFPTKHVRYPTSCKTHTLRRMALASTNLVGIDERDFQPLLDQVRAIRSAMVTEVTFRAPEDDTENTARLYITLDHCLTEGKLEELVA